MRLERLTLKNWCQHRHLELKFGPGINGLTGSNGHGKSNALDALRYGVTGQSVNHGVKGDNVTWGETKGWVEVEFSDGERKITIRRNSHDAGISVKVSGEAPVTKLGEANLKIEQLLGANSSALLDNVFVQQGQIDSILLLDPSKRLKEFQQVFGLGACEDIHRLLGAEPGNHRVDETLDPQLTTATAQLVEAKQKHGPLAERVQQLKRVVDQLDGAVQVVATAQARREADFAVQQAQKNVDIQLAAHQTAQAATRKAEHDAQALHGTLEPIVAQDANLQARRATIEHQLNNWDQAEQLRLQITAAKQVVLEAQAVPNSQIDEHTFTSLQQATEQTRGRLAQILAMQQGNRPRLAAEEQAEQQHAQASANLRAYPLAPANSEATLKLTAQRDELRRHAGKFDQGVCPTCGQAVDGGPEAARQRAVDMAAVEQQLTGQMGADRAAWVTGRQQLIEAEALAAGVVQQYRQAAVDVLRQQYQVVAQQLASQEAEVNQIGNARKAFTQAQRDLDLLYARASDLPTDPPDVEELKRVKAAIQGVADARQQLQRVDGDLRVAQMAEASAKAQLTTFDQQLKQLAERVTNQPGVDVELVGKAEQFILEFSARRTEHSQAAQELSILEGQLKYLDQQAERLRRAVEVQARAARWVQIVNRTREVFHVSQLTTMLMRAYGQVINRRLDHYLREWGGPFQMRLNDELAFRVRFPGQDTEVDARRLSGGQKIVAGVSFRLAMVDTFARQVGLLVLDEPTNYLDHANIQNFQQALLRLREISGRQGRQILVVTHEQSLTNFFDSVNHLDKQ